MDAAHVVQLVAAAVGLLVAAVLVAVAATLVSRVRRLERVVTQLEMELLPLARQARSAADQALTEMTRVGDVLGSAESVSSTVDSASRLAYQAFSNPVVKVVAYGSGLSRALHRLFGRTVVKSSPP